MLLLSNVRFMNDSLLSVSKNWPFFLFDLEGNFCHLVGRYAFSMFTKMPFSMVTNESTNYG